MVLWPDVLHAVRQAQHRYQCLTLGVRRGHSGEHQPWHVRRASPRRRVGTQQQRHVLPRVVQATHRQQVAVFAIRSRGEPLRVDAGVHDLDRRLGTHQRPDLGATGPVDRDDDVGAAERGAFDDADRRCHQLPPAIEGGPAARSVLTAFVLHERREMDDQGASEPAHGIGPGRRAAHDVQDVAALDQLQNRPPPAVPRHLDLGPHGADVIHRELLDAVARDERSPPCARAAQKNARGVGARGRKRHDLHRGAELAAEGAGDEQRLLANAAGFPQVGRDDGYAHGSMSPAPAIPGTRSRASWDVRPPRRLFDQPSQRRVAGDALFPDATGPLPGASSHRQVRLRAHVEALPDRGGPLPVIQRHVPAHAVRRQLTPRCTVAHQHRTPRRPGFDDDVTEVLAERRQDHDVIVRQAALEIAMRRLAGVLDGDGRRQSRHQTAAAGPVLRILERADDVEVNVTVTAGEDLQQEMQVLRRCDPRGEHGPETSGGFGRPRLVGRGHVRHAFRHARDR